MAEIHASLLSVEDFARKANCPPRDVLRQLKDGSLSGRMVDNIWYADVKALQQLDTASKPQSAVTAIMLAAANLNWQEVLDAINARRASPLKATTPEFGLNIELIHAEAKLAKRRARWSDVVIGIAALYGIVVALGGYESNVSDELLMADGGGTSVMFQLLLVLFVITLADLVVRRQALKRARELLASCAERAADGAAVSHDEQRNVTISGGYTPFVGSGVDIGGWSFTVNLTEPDKEGADAEAVTVMELYAETEQSLDKLDISAMAVRDEVYIDGRDVRGVDILMPGGAFDRPIEAISESLMAAQIDRNDNVVRHYKVIRLQLWNGQIVLSTLFRYVIISDTLFVEAKTLILPPLKEKFLDLQNMPLVAVRWELFNAVIVSALRSTVIWIPVLWRALAYIQGGFFNQESRWLKANAKEVEANQKYNYGWDKSLRETWAGTGYSRYFQMIGQDFYGKMVKETLLDSLLKSLERRHISTEALKNASTKIYNEGVIINGGAVNAENIAAGSGAQASVKKFMRAAQSAPANV